LGSVEDDSMSDGQIIEDLKKCMNEAKGKKDRTDCEKAFTDAGGTVVAEGGTVFSAPAGGGKVFVTDGGKVVG
jgi:hypothetical protein